MAEQTTTSFYLFSFSHYILNDVDTSNCKAMISMIKATSLFFIYQLWLNAISIISLSCYFETFKTSVSEYWNLYHVNDKIKYKQLLLYYINVMVIKQNFQHRQAGSCNSSLPYNSLVRTLISNLPKIYFANSWTNDCKLGYCMRIQAIRKVK